MTAPIALRPFTSNDWRGLDGAACFADGSAPLIGELAVVGSLAAAEVVYDADGLQVTLVGTDERGAVADVAYTWRGARAVLALLALHDGMSGAALRALPGCEVGS